MKKMYSFSYMTEIFKDKEDKRYNYLTADVDLQAGDYVIIEKKGTGLFLGIIECFVDDCRGDEIYTMYDKIDLSAYFDKLKREERKKELKEEMEKQFKKIDKQKKYEYYSTLDEEFAKLYDEYKNL